MPEMAPMLMGSGGPAGQAVPPPPPSGPQAAPMAQPTPNQGNQQMGMVQVETAVQILEQALPALGTTTPEGKAVLTALSALAKQFSRQEAGPLVPAQIMEMAQASKPSALQQMLSQGQQPGAGAPPPAQ